MVSPGNSYREMLLLSMEVSTEDESLYRIQIGSRVKYITIELGVFDYETVMSYPPALLPALYPLPEGDWISMTISRGTEGQNIQTLDYNPLPAVESIWHSNLVDILSLQEIGRIGPRVRVVRYEGRPAIAKIARFDWEIQYIETETIAYRKLAGKNLAPTFLGHLLEEGRVMGILLEKLDGRSADLDDFESCKSIVTQVHDTGIIHGDLNKYNFIVRDKQTWLIDFENALAYEAALGAQELEGILAQLKEQSGRGNHQGLNTSEADIQPGSGSSTN